MDGRSIIELLTGGGSFALLVYILVVGIPKWLETFRQEQQLARDTFTKQLQYEREQCSEQFNHALAITEKHHDDVIRRLEIVESKRNGAKGPLDK